MKKIYKYILVIAMMIFISIGEVKAKDYLNDECVNEGTCKLVCKYESGDDKVNLYYFEGSKEFKVTYSWKDDYAREFNLNGGHAFIDPTNLDKMKNEEFYCPKYIYKYSGFWKINRLCIDDNGTYCKNNDKIKKYFKDSTQLIIETKPIINREQANKNKISCEDVYKEKLKDESDFSDVCGYSGTDSTDKKKYFFIATIANQYKYYEINDKDQLIELSTSSVQDIGWEASCNAHKELYYISSTNEKGEYLSGYYSQNPTKLTYIPNSLINPTGGVYYTNYQYNRYCEYKEERQTSTPNNYDDCISLLGEDLVNEINSYMLYIKIAVPIIIIVMGSIDFGRAFIASDEEAMKKAQKRFIMRLIIGIIIFFIPTILNALLNIANSVWAKSYDTCGITF